MISGIFWFSSSSCTKILNLCFPKKKFSFLHIFRLLAYSCIIIIAEQKSLCCSSHVPSFLVQPDKCGGEYTSVTSQRHQVRPANYRLFNCYSASPASGSCYLCYCNLFRAPSCLDYFHNLIFSSIYVSFSIITNILMTPPFSLPVHFLSFLWT